MKFNIAKVRELYKIKLSPLISINEQGKYVADPSYYQNNITHMSPYTKTFQDRKINIPAAALGLNIRRPYNLNFAFQSHDKEAKEICFKLDQISGFNTVIRYGHNITVSLKTEKYSLDIKALLYKSVGNKKCTVPLRKKLREDLTSYFKDILNEPEFTLENFLERDLNLRNLGYESDSVLKEYIKGLSLFRIIKIRK